MDFNGYISENLPVGLVFLDVRRCTMFARIFAR